MTTLWTRMREAIKRGEKLRYIVRNPNRPPSTGRAVFRGIGWTRKDKTITKHKRQMIKASRRRNR